MRSLLHPVAALSALLLLTPQLVLAAPVAAVAAAQAAQAESATAQIAAAPAPRKVVKCFKSKDYANLDAALTEICVKSESYRAVCPTGLSEPDWIGKGSNTYCDTCICANP